MQMADILLSRLVNQLRFHIMRRAFRVAVQPDPRPVDAASRRHLLDEAARKKRHFVCQRPRSRQALQTVLASFVVRVVEVVDILADLDPRLIARGNIHVGKPPAPQDLKRGSDNVFLQSADSLACQNERLALKRRKAPSEKAADHRDCLTRTNRAICDDRIAALIRAAVHVPVHQLQLLRRKRTERKRMIIPRWHIVPPVPPASASSPSRTPR